MKRKLAICLVLALLLAALWIPTASAADHGVFHDETDALGSVEMTYMGQELLPEFTQTYNIDMRVDVLIDQGVNVNEAALFIYEEYGYGCGEAAEGITLTLLMSPLADGSYALVKDGWCVLTTLTQEHGGPSDIHEAIRAAVEPYMAARAWDGSDMNISATALIQAVDAMHRTAQEYILAHFPPESAGEDQGQTGTETAPPATAAPALAGVLDPECRIFDLSGRLSSAQWEDLETRAQDISRRHDCGVYALFVDNYKTYSDGGNDPYVTLYQLYHANGLGLGEDRNGVIILLSMENRAYAMFVYGPYGEYALDEYGAEKLEEEFLGDFGENQWYTGLSHYLEACDSYLTRADAGHPVRQSPWALIGVAVLLSCCIAGSICGWLKRSMRSVRPGAWADDYISADGLTLTDGYEHYTHTTTTRVKVRDESDSGSSSGSTSSCSGGGGHGRSGTF